MIVEHGIDGGVTLARATLNEWGIAVQVPAGQIKVSLEIVDASGAGVNPSTIGVFTSVASGFLRERRVPVTIPTNAAVGTVFQPPPFAAVCDAWYLGPLGGSMTIVPAVTNVALALDAGNIPRTTFEACPVSILSGAGNGAATLDWIIYE